jgi:hypothetical protein
LIISERENKL